MYNILRSPYLHSGPHRTLRSSLERHPLAIRRRCTCHISPLFLPSPRDVQQEHLCHRFFLLHVACRRRWQRAQHARRNSRPSWHNQVLHQRKNGELRHHVGHHPISQRHPHLHRHHMAACSWLALWGYWHRWNVVLRFWKTSTGVFKVTIARWTGVLPVEWF